MTASSLTSLFYPKSIALVGASDRSPWSQLIAHNFSAYGFEGNRYAVNINGNPAHGLAGFKSCKELPETVDVAYIYVPLEGVLSAIIDAGEAGIKAAVVLTSGFGEAGDEGKALQAELLATASRFGMRLLGPNSLGFANYNDGYCLTAIGPRMPLNKGTVSVVSQSGATLNDIASYAHDMNIGINYIVATGNEAMIDIIDVTDFLIDDPNTKVIALYAEAITDASRFRKVAERAMAAKKPIVILKVGTSEITAAVAQAHTGSMVGDDKVFEAATRQLGLIRVKTIEDLVITSGMLAKTGALAKKGVGLVSISGGACTQFADLAELAGVNIPAFAPETTAALNEVMPGYASTLNPFDITGAAVVDPSLFEKCISIIGQDPSIGIVLCVMDMPNAEGLEKKLAHMHAAIGQGLDSLDIPAFFVNTALKPVNEVSRRVMKTHKIPATFGGLDHVARALGKITWWSTSLKRHIPSVETPPTASSMNKPVGERQVLDYLADYKVPVVPGVITTTAAEAASVAREMGGKVSMKIASPDIAHKSDIGGVKLNIEGDKAVTEAFDQIDASVRNANPSATVEGIIVSPMRNIGTELFIGTAMDPDWGPVIAVGLGGIWVEALADTALGLLPVRKEEVIEMMMSLRGAELLQGYRGTQAVDLEAFADVVVKVGDAVLALGPELAALEINPLSANGNKIEALDGLTVWKDKA